ncbi:hypothetical protein D9619_004979 [Psilocybe cf. subviscida]|uniref:DUF6534 domain-containing protein n=1 Tax=Psilocybe cf. subviscida TaxID=2480587 RepID=A0A8H5BRV8_9AGAR|nr:hypothetical protein D9619_004979 [Psilocybe cf. subviscida]
MSGFQQLNLDNTLGAAFIGNIVASVPMCTTRDVKGIIPPSKHWRVTRLLLTTITNGTRALRYTSYGMLLDTLHLALVTNSLYLYLIKNYNNPIALLSPNWSILAQVFVTGVCDLIVRAIFGRRVWKISGSYLVAAFIKTISAATAFSSGTAFACRAFVGKTFANFSHISYLMYLALGTAVLADIGIAASLCISLARSRTGFARTDSIVAVLMLYAINSSVLTTACSFACFITYLIWPHQFTFIGIYVCLSKLFLNSLLAMLNGRVELKERMTRNFSEQLQRSYSTARHVEFSRSAFSNTEINQKPSPVVISVNTEIEMKETV